MIPTGGNRHHPGQPRRHRRLTSGSLPRRPPSRRSSAPDCDTHRRQSPPPRSSPPAPSSGHSVLSPGDHRPVVLQRQTVIATGGNRRYPGQPGRHRRRPESFYPQATTVPSFFSARL